MPPPPSIWTRTVETGRGGGGDVRWLAPRAICGDRRDTRLKREIWRETRRDCGIEINAPAVVRPLLLVYNIIYYKTFKGRGKSGTTFDWVLVVRRERHRRSLSLSNLFSFSVFGSPYNRILTILGLYRFDMQKSHQLLDFIILAVLNIILDRMQDTNYDLHHFCVCYHTIFSIEMIVVRQCRVVAWKISLSR